MKVRLLAIFLHIIPIVLGQSGEIIYRNINEYQTIRIGNQNWITENLNVTTFQNGDSIFQARTAEEWERAGLNGDPACFILYLDTINKINPCVFYNFYAVVDHRGLAPLGFHVPTEAEFQILINNLGGEMTAGKKMKSANGWQSEDNVTNSSEFNGKPFGCITTSMDFVSFGYNAEWWCSNDSSPIDGLKITLFDNVDHVSFGSYSKIVGCSVRCLKD
jgi:uncharacterized protein (TIGR02145 family)